MVDNACRPYYSNVVILYLLFHCSAFRVYQYTSRAIFSSYTGLYCTISTIVMYFMRIHTGLIRYSNTRDVLRIFSSVFLSSMIYLLAINIWVVHVSAYKPGYDKPGFAG